MRMKSFSFTLFVLSVLVLLWINPALAQSSQDSGKLKIHVEPKQAYVFVDGRAIRNGSQAIRLAPGAHSVDVRNYGYTAQAKDVQVSAQNETKLDVDLQRFGDKVTGPFADLEFKGDRHAAVLLNGTTPAYFVGNASEFDWDWIFHKRLLLQPGSYHVTVKRDGNTVWSGEVTAEAGRKVIVYLDKNGKMITKNFHAGDVLGPQPRFHAGFISDTVPVAAVTTELAVNSGNVSCGQSTTLKWDSANAADTSISGLGTVPNEGSRDVSPTRNMTYLLKAVGPGGESSKTVTVDVNAQPAATLALSQPEIQYHKIGDKVVEQGSATLHWTASNASSASIEPFGDEGTNGSRTIMADPKSTSVGPVNEDLSYTFTASNPCGGSVTKTATLHVVGSIDPPPNTTLASVFYPTAYPTKSHPKFGLVPSEKAALDQLATQFKNLGNYEENANLVIVGYADIRGSERYNQALSERRAQLAEDYLVSKGIPAAELKIQAKGKDDQIAPKTVESLQAKDVQMPEKWMKKDGKATWLAYNRRVDIVLEPTGQQSTKMYPNDAATAHLLWQRSEPSVRALAKIAGSSAGAEMASLNTHGN